MKPQLQLIRRETGEVLLSAFIEMIQEPRETDSPITVSYRAFLSSETSTIQLKNLGRFDGAGYRVQLDEEETQMLRERLAS
jgi:hypothetical protein